MSKESRACHNGPSGKYESSHPKLHLDRARYSLRHEICLRRTSSIASVVRVPIHVTCTQKRIDRARKMLSDPALHTLTPQAIRIQTRPPRLTRQLFPKILSTSEMHCSTALKTTELAPRAIERDTVSRPVILQ